MKDFSKTLHFIALVILTLAIGCKSDDAPEGIQEENQLEAFLNETIDIMEMNSINRLTIDWEDFRSSVLNTMGNDRFISQADPALIRALRLLDDNHSLIRKPDGRFLSGRRSGCNIETSTRPDLPEDIGYVKIRGYGGASSGEDAQVYMQEIRDQIRAEDKDSLTGWVVDLRGNTGGNMYPMIAGIGPILGEGIAGNFIDPIDTRIPWGYVNHGSAIGNNRISITADRYELITPNPKVAVLIDGGVASSGEAVAISFIGRENTKLFGTPSCGVSTANSGFDLSNGFDLILTVSVMADRNLNKFGGAIQPDEVTTPVTLVDALTEWFRNG